MDTPVGISRVEDSCAGQSQAGVTTVTEFPWAAQHKKIMPTDLDTAETGALFQTYRDRIYRYILRMVKNPAEAEDLAQETFLRAYRRRDSLRDPNAVRGWLYRIAAHACLDRLRQRKIHESIDRGESADEIIRAASQSPSVLEIAERRETSACVQRCLDYLPDRYRAVILLYEAHSLTAAEIAELLGLKLTTVKMRLHRAHRMLQQVMEVGCAVSSDKCGVPTCQPKS
jgi:RNA polymerase sigma-70 factor, ECF subfamily